MLALLLLTFRRVAFGGGRQVLSAVLIGLALLSAGRPLPIRATGTWQQITNSPLAKFQHMLLLSDGSVMLDAGYVDSTNYYSTNYFYRLVPDQAGHYAHGTWSSLTPSPLHRLFYASDVLPDGRVYISGGEYPQDGLRGGTNATIFDPQGNGGSGSWTSIGPPPGFIDSTNEGFADNPSVVLANGTVLVSPVYGATKNTALIYNPISNSWKFAASALVGQDEATWIKLPNDSILSIDVRHANEVATNQTSSEHYVPSLDMWVADPLTPCPTDGYGAETGGGFMTPNGNALFLLGSGHTLFYTPAGITDPGAWTQGPDMPLLPPNQVTNNVKIDVTTNADGGVVFSTNNFNQLSPEDAPAAMLPSGKILCEFSVDEVHSPVWFFEFDPTKNTTASAFAPLPTPVNPTNGVPYFFDSISDNTSMLLLPDGTVLYSDAANLFLYIPDNTPPAAIGKPAIQGWSLNKDGSLHLWGTAFNGFSSGTSYGDDWQMDSNFPLVRFTDSQGNVTFGRTYNWSCTGVQTGSRVVTTECTVPAAVATSTGVYSMQVVVNGVASDPLTFTGPSLVWVDFNQSPSQPQLGTFTNPFSTLNQGVQAVVTGDNVFIKAGASAEKPVISKPLILQSYGGTAIIGRKP